MDNEISIDVHQLWDKLLRTLEGNLNKPVFETLISSVKPLSVVDGTLLLGIPNKFTGEWLAERGCDLLLLENIKIVGDKKIQALRWVVIPSTPIKEEPLPLETSEKKPLLHSRNKTFFLNPRYTFDNFVVGAGNRFAHAAALAIAEAPAKAYNPLFIYGGVGLGKTHLMQAIGHRFIKAWSQAKVLYVTSEQFTNDFINSLQDGNPKAFRNRYRNTDILLLDDIQFLAGKERSKEEFFHTFNALHESSRQVVLSSDRPPKEIPNLEERLRSRFEWGLTADIQPPDLETRIAILRKKAELEEFSIPDEVMNFIATRLTSNIRELEGALTRIIAYTALTGSEVSVAVADDILRDILSPTKGKPVTINLIKKATAEYYSLKIEDMSAKTRTREIATARQVAMYLARELTNASLPKVGEEFGGRDHTTVMHACEKIKESIRTRTEVDEAVRNIINKVKQAA